MSKKERFTQWLSVLRTSGYRLTDSRRALVEIFTQGAQVLSPEELLELASQHHSHLGRATVYRTVETLIALGLVRRIHDAHGCHSFMAVMDDNPQALLICNDCQRVDVAPSSDMLAQLTQSIEQATGYTIQNQFLQLSGMCTNCQ